MLVIQYSGYCTKERKRGETTKREKESELYFVVYSYISVFNRILYF